MTIDSSTKIIVFTAAPAHSGANGRYGTTESAGPPNYTMYIIAACAAYSTTKAKRNARWQGRQR